MEMDTTMWNNNEHISTSKKFALKKKHKEENIKKHSNEEGF